MEVFTVELPGHRKLVLSNGGGSFLVQDDFGNSIQMNSGGVKIKAGAKIELECTHAVISASDLKVNASAATFAGKVKADSVQANSIDGASYTPGAGNIL